MHSRSRYRLALGRDLPVKLWQTRRCENHSQPQGTF